MLLPIVCDVCNVFLWDHFSWNVVAIVECTSDIDWCMINIMAGKNSISWQWSVSR